MRVAVALSFLILASACLLALGSKESLATHGGMDAMSIDTNEEATPANTSTSIGSREFCHRINENNVLDADEDVVDGLVIDITAEGIPPFNDGGTPGNQIDDSGGIVAYQFVLGYSSANLTVDSDIASNSAINILAANPGSSILNPSDATPDDNSDDSWYAAAIDTGASTPESGTGNLHRLTLVSEAAAVAGVYPLTLSDHVHVDASGNAFFPHQTNKAYLTVNMACGDFDGDGVADAEDACLELVGIPQYNGCPPPGPPVVGGTVGLVGAETSPPAAADEGTSVATYILNLAVGATIATAAAWYAATRLVARGRARR